MKIAISGTQNVGKSTYVKDFLKNWTNYTTPPKSYRDYIKEKKLPHSKESDENTQKLILDALLDQAQEYSKNDNVIFDRCVLDNLAYCSWLNLNGKVSDKFLDQTRIIVREFLSTFDIVFFIPLSAICPVEIVDNGIRETDPVFREEIDNLFTAFVKSYHKGDGRVFPKDGGNCPAVIEIFGTPIERIKLTELYLNKEGQPYEENESSLISDIYTGR